MAALSLEQILALAYERAERHADTPGAVKALQQAFADSQLRAAGEAERARLDRVLAKRSVGNLCACHISKTMSELLRLALGGRE